MNWRGEIRKVGGVGRNRLTVNREDFECGERPSSYSEHMLTKRMIG